jgi:inhibitor of KinA sporulation pathway (predicted exonuclease)
VWHSGSVLQHPALGTPLTHFPVQVQEFHAFVRPTDGAAVGSARVLSAFCTELTGITQSQVENAPPLPAVLGDFHKWLQTHEMEDKRLCFVTCGDWDLGEMLPTECERKSIPFPSVCAAAPILHP